MNVLVSRLRSRISTVSPSRTRSDTIPAAGLKSVGREAATNRGNNNPYDRRIRDSISRWRDVDLIVSSSSSGGYWLAEDMNDVETIAQEYISRSREMEELAKNLRRRGTEVFGPQMPLFGKVN